MIRQLFPITGAFIKLETAKQCRRTMAITKTQPGGRNHRSVSSVTKSKLNRKLILPSKLPFADDVAILMQTPAL